MVCFHRQNPPTQPQPLGVLSNVVLLTFKVKPSCLCQTWRQHCPWCFLQDHLIVWQANGLWCYCCFGCHTLWGIVLVFIIVPIRWVDGDLPCLLLVRMAGNCTYARQRSCKLSFRLGTKNHRITSLRLFVDQHRSLTLFSFPNFVFKVALLGFIRLRTKIASRMTLITKF